MKLKSKDPTCFLNNTILLNFILHFKFLDKKSRFVTFFARESVEQYKSDNYLFVMS